MNKDVLKLIMQVKMLIALLTGGASIYDQEVVDSIEEVERLIHGLQSTD